MEPFYCLQVSRTVTSIGSGTRSPFRADTQRMRRTAAFLFDPHGRLAPILKRRAGLGPNAYVFGSPAGEFVADFQTAWESLLLVANGHDTKGPKPGARVDRAKLRQIGRHFHDLRHEGACRLLSDGVDIRTIQLMLGHADIKQTQRYLNITDEELRKAMTGVWQRRRGLRAVAQ